MEIKLNIRPRPMGIRHGKTSFHDDPTDTPGVSITSDSSSAWQVDEMIR